MSNYLSIKRIYVIEPASDKLQSVMSSVSEMMEDANLGIEWGGIYNNNWQTEYPYTPKVEFMAAHNNKALFLKFKVEEECIKAEARNDNDAVWKDSCVEFFISFDDKGYYNFEFSCIGKKLAGFHPSDGSKNLRASQELLDKIVCVSTLGTDNFEERRGKFNWEMIVTIPNELFFEHSFETLEGLFARANAYKCGDDLTKPHFLSWNPIANATPNFHLPEHFGRVRFL